MVKLLKLSSTANPIRQSTSMKKMAPRALTCPLGSGRPARPRDLCVDVAVDEVVIGAARRAHDERAHREQDQEPRIGIGFAQAAPGKRHRPEAGEGEQEKADRAVGAGEPEIGDERRWARSGPPSCAAPASEIALALPWGWDVSCA